MNKKRDAVFLVLIISAVVFLSLISFVSAETNASTANLTGFDKSYSCLKDMIDTASYSSMTSEELAFSLLALGYDSTRQSELKSELDKRKDSTNACWPSGNCDVRLTSIVLKAYDYINTDTRAIQNWLLNQTMAPGELVWYMQVENPSDELMACTVKYDTTSASVTINPDKTISGSAGSCFSSANGYWLEVKSSCYDKDFEITCDKDSLISLLYRRTTDSNKFFVSATTDQGSPGTKVRERVESVCMKQGSSCTYEGSLWATLALNKNNADFRNKILPYLMALSSDSGNQRLIPSSFLYALTGFDDYFTELTGLQKTEGYWQATTDSTRRYYDTAVALLSLYGKSGQADAAATYLLLPNVQGEGCWGNNLLNTAFLLSAVNPKVPSSGGGTSRTSCLSVDNHPEYSCTARDSCSEVNGSVLNNFYCIGSGDICCSKEPPSKPSCSSKGGQICSLGEECSSGGFANTLESYCCVNGDCNLAQEPAPTLTACENAGYTCNAACDSGTQDNQPYACSGIEICCSPKASSSYWWVILLVILIILLALAIIFRNQVKIWWFRIKSKFKKQPIAPQQRPGMPGSPPFRMPPQQFGGPRRMLPPGMMPLRPGAPVRRPFPKEKELDETLKKLKDMSKR